MTDALRDELERWRSALFELADTAPPRSDCPDSDELWAGAHGTLEPSAAEALLDHVADCPACTEAWRLARRLGDGTEVARREPRTTRAARTGRRSLIGWAAAATLVLASVGWWMRPDPPPTTRQSAATWITPTVPATAMSRDEVVLTWEAPADATFGVRVSTDDLRVVATATDLDRPEYRVPPDALASIPPSGSLFWQVTADLPDGRRIVSDTFEARVE